MREGGRERAWKQGGGREEKGREGKEREGKGRKERKGKERKGKERKERQERKQNIPGSIGHSFSVASSAGLFPVNTQLELSSIIGILVKEKK